MCLFYFIGILKYLRQYEAIDRLRYYDTILIDIINIDMLFILFIYITNRFLKKGTLGLRLTLTDRPTAKLLVYYRHAFLIMRYEILKTYFSIVIDCLT